MKRHLLFTAAALLFSCFARGQQLTAAEYFFDTDPGVGNGTSLTVTTGDSILFSGSIPATSLSTGFHFLYIRSKDSNGAWQISERRMFFIHSGNTTVATLTAAEYFFDTEPGVGNGTPLTVMGGDSILFSGNISAASLSNGFHFLYIRAKDANGTWGIRERRMIYIQSGSVSTPSLSAAEYFFDTDPGVGNGTALTIVPGDSILFSGTIPSGALPVGFHMLYIRTKDLNGTWGLAERRVLYIQPLAVAAPILVAAEYFVNYDPGVGNGTALTVIPGDSIDFSGPITVADTAVGIDSLYIRVRDLAGKWSLYEAREFQISPIGVEEIPGNNGSVLFQNYPNPFSRSTAIDYYLQSSADVTFYVTDLIGKTVREVRLGHLAPGKHSVFMNYSSLEEGYYFYKIVAGDFTDTKQMVHLKE
jgi:hypothetical protein